MTQQILAVTVNYCTVHPSPLSPQRLAVFSAKPSTGILMRWSGVLRFDRKSTHYFCQRLLFKGGIKLLLPSGSTQTRAFTGSHSIRTRSITVPLKRTGGANSVLLGMTECLRRMTRLFTALYPNGNKSVNYPPHYTRSGIITNPQPFYPRPPTPNPLPSDP